MHVAVKKWFEIRQIGYHSDSMWFYVRLCVFSVLAVIVDLYVRPFNYIGLNCTDLNTGFLISDVIRFYTKCWLLQKTACASSQEITGQHAPNHMCRRLKQSIPIHTTVTICEEFSFATYRVAFNFRRGDGNDYLCSDAAQLGTVSM